MLKVLIEEEEKEEKQQDKSIINQLSKTIADNSKVLGEFGMAPPVISKLKNMITMNYINNNENNMVEEELRALTERPKAKSGFYLSMDDGHDNENESIKINESQCILKDHVYVAFEIIYDCIFKPYNQKNTTSRHSQIFPDI